MTGSVDPLIGYTFGRYTIEDFQDEEWLGKVYTARDRKGELVCIKVLHPHLAENQEVLTRFHQEMLATATVEHPNTVRMIDFGEQRLFRFVVLEYVAGRTLREALDRGEAFGAKRVARIGAQLAEVLAMAHEQHIVHRNLNPHNVLLLDNAKGDYVKVRDFGMSKLRDDFQNPDNLTAVGSRLGTTGYMAPEYIDTNVVDPRGDIYALGLILFELLTGRPPFTGKPGQVLEAHVTQPPPRPSELVRGVPAWLDELILQCLAKHPGGRPQDGWAVKEALERGLGEDVVLPELVEIGQDGTPVAPVPRPARRMGSSKGLLGLAVTVAFGVLAALIVAILLAVLAWLVLG